MVGFGLKYFGLSLTVYSKLKCRRWGRQFSSLTLVWTPDTSGRMRVRKRLWSNLEHLNVDVGVYEEKNIT